MAGNLKELGALELNSGAVEVDEVLRAFLLDLVKDVLDILNKSG